MKTFRRASSDFSLARLLRYHRTVLIVGTALISIAASRIANRPTSWSDYFVLVGGALLLAVADLLREAEVDAQALSRSSGELVSVTRRHVAAAREPTQLKLRVAAAGVLLAIGFVGWIWTGLSEDDAAPQEPARPSVTTTVPALGSTGVVTTSAPAVEKPASTVMNSTTASPNPPP